MRRGGDLGDLRDELGELGVPAPRSSAEIIHAGRVSVRLGEHLGARAECAEVEAGLPRRTLSDGVRRTVDEDPSRERVGV